MNYEPLEEVYFDDANPST